MLRRSLIIAFAVWGLIAWAADDNTDKQTGLTADKCLQAAPLSAFDLININTRLDMIDYFHAGSTHPSTNAIGGECYITADSDYSLEMVTGTDMTCQIFVLNPNDQYPYIGVIETINTPVPDSKITFYNHRWAPLILNVFTEPNLAQWLTKEGKKKQAVVEDQIPFIMASYYYDPETQRLTVKNNMGEYFLASDTPEAMKYINDEIVYVWDGDKFKLSK